MPYEIVKRGDEFCVAKKDDGTILDGACHVKREEAVAQMQAIEISEYGNKRVAFGSAIKALGDNRIGGYLVEFTDENNKDLDGEYFTKDTEFHLDQYPLVGTPVIFNHGLDDALKMTRLGTIIKAEVNDVGLWVEAKLEEHQEYNKYVEGVHALRSKGVLSWSSGAFPQSVEYGENGFIKTWIIQEGSETHTPANPTGTKITNLKSIASNLLDSTEFETKENDTALADLTLDVKYIQTTVNEILNATKDSTMDMEKMRNEIMRMVDERLKEVLGEDMDKGSYMDMAEVETEIEAKMESEDDENMKSFDVSAFSDELALKLLGKIEAKQKRDAEFAKRKAERNAKGVSKVGAFQAKAPRLEMNDLRYSSMDASDMAFGAMVCKQKNIPISTEYMRAMVAKASEYANSNPYKTHDAQKTVADNMAIKSSVPWKANELDASNIAGQGDEWVGEFWVTDVWRRERFPLMWDTFVSKGMQIRELGKGTENAHFPTEGADPVAYTAPQANNLDATGRPEVTYSISPFGTGEVIVTPKEIKVATSITQILDEDSVVNTIAQANYQVQRKMLETRDQILINADTETGANANINLIDGTPATGLQTPYYINSNGLRKLALVTNTALAEDSQGAINDIQYLKALQNLPEELQTRIDNLVYIVNPRVYTASLPIPEVKTDDVNFRAGTVHDGVLRKMWGIDLFNSGFLPLANSAGFVSKTASNNTTGTIILAYAPYWAAAYKRQITTRVVEFPMSSTDVFLASMRIGVIARSDNANTLMYNVGVTV